MYIWLAVCCGSISRLIIFFALNNVILSLTLKERGIHAYLARLLWQHPWIDIFFRFKRLNCLARLLWHYLSIDNFFRFRGVILSLTLKERDIRAYLACLLWQHPWIDIFFRFKRLNCYYASNVFEMHTVRMQFSDRVRIENDLFHPYGPYGSTTRNHPSHR